MEDTKSREIARLIYNKGLSNLMVDIIVKNANGFSVETEIKEFSEKLSITEKELKDFFNKFDDFKHLA